MILKITKTLSHLKRIILTMEINENLMSVMFNQQVQISRSIFIYFKRFQKV